LFVVFGDRSYKDYVDLSRAEFYRMLASEPVLPITSQPTPAMFEAAFAPYAAAGDEILCLTISSRLSGTMNAASAAAQRFPQTRIEIYDSRTVAAGLGMMALRANELVTGGASITEVRHALDAMREAQRLYACLPDLTHVQRTGRIGKAQAVLGTLMKIVPVLGLHDGQVVAEAQVRTFARAQATMLDLALGAAGDPANTRFVVMHTNAPHLADVAAEQLRARLGDTVPLMLEIWEAGPVIATHAGAGAVGVFVTPG
jgi:DegV family protein with EDD domain